MNRDSHSYSSVFLEEKRFTFSDLVVFSRKTNRNYIKVDHWGNHIKCCKIDHIKRTARLQSEMKLAQKCKKWNVANQNIQHTCTNCWYGNVPSPVPLLGLGSTLFKARFPLFNPSGYPPCLISTEVLLTLKTPSKYLQSLFTFLPFTRNYGIT